MAETDSTSILAILWTEFCTHFKIPQETVGEKWLGCIQAQYQRPCNDLDSLAFKLQKFESCKQYLNYPDTVFLALIFQSIHYVTNATDNVDKSVAKFEEFASDAGFNTEHAEMVKRVSDLIEISVNNSCNEFWEDGTFGTADTHYFMDINFAHLGQEWNDYKILSEKTRNEYEFLDGESYAKLRRKILQSFLHIPKIFSTAVFRTELEDKARKNIQQEIDELNQQ